MAFVRERLQQLKTAWGQMTGTGRLSMVLIGLLVIAMILLITQEAGSRDMEPLPTRFASGEINKSAGALQSSGIRSEIRGNQIYVPVGKIEAAISVLASNDALSAEFEIDFEQLFTASSLWQSDTDRERRLQLFITRKLEGCISQMQAVQRASVTINFGSRHTLHSVPKGASASVSVQTARSRPLDKATAVAIADLLAGAINGLDRKDVKIVDVTNAVSFNLADDGLAASGDYIPLLRQYETHFNDNLRDLFPHIPGLFVKARVIPNIHVSTVRTRTVDPRSIIPGTLIERSAVLAGGSASGDVGVAPNVGTDPAAGSAAAHSDTTTEDHTSAPIDYGFTESLMQRLAGEVDEIGAAINIPRSYFVNIARMQAGGDANAEIDESKLATITDAEKARIHRLAIGILQPKDPDNVVVESYPDFVSTMAGPGGSEILEAGSGSFELLAMAKDIAPSAGLLLLALAALWMLFGLVRRVQPVALPSEATFATEGVSEAGLTLDSILEGVELEADTIRASKMQEQISSMIKEDPDAMANLVKRWISQE